MKWLINLPNIFDEKVTCWKLTSESLIYFEVRVIYIQKLPPRGVLKKRCSENMQQILALRHGCSPVNLLHILRTPFPRNTSGWLLLYICITRFKNLRYNSVWRLLALFPGNDFPVFLITKCFMLDMWKDSWIRLCMQFIRLVKVLN